MDRRHNLGHASRNMLRSPLPASDGLPTRTYLPGGRCERDCRGRPISQGPSRSTSCTSGRSRTDTQRCVPPWLLAWTDRRPSSVERLDDLRQAVERETSPSNGRSCRVAHDGTVAGVLQVDRPPDAHAGFERLIRWHRLRAPLPPRHGRSPDTASRAGRRCRPDPDARCRVTTVEQLPGPAVVLRPRSRRSANRPNQSSPTPARVGREPMLEQPSALSVSPSSKYDSAIARRRFSTISSVLVREPPQRLLAHRDPRAQKLGSLSPAFHERVLEVLAPVEQRLVHRAAIVDRGSSRSP